MKITDNLEQQRIYLYLAISFGIAWATFLAIYLTGGLVDSPLVFPEANVSLALLLMAGPVMSALAIAHLLTRIITREGHSSQRSSPTGQQDHSVASSHMMLTSTGEEPVTKKQRDLLIEVTIILAAFGLRLWQINGASLWYDETFTIGFADQTLPEVITDLLYYDNAPPLFGILLSIWIKFVGNTEFTTRLLPAFLGTASVAMIGRWAAEMSGERSAWGAMLVMTTLPVYVYYSQEVRYPSLAIFLAALFGWATWRFTIGKKTTGRMSTSLLFILSGVTMIATHAFTGFLWAVYLVVGAGQWIINRRTFSSRRWIKANITLGLSILPIAAWMLWRASVDATAGSATGWDMIKYLPIEMGVALYLPEPWATIFPVIGGASGLVGILIVLNRHQWTQVNLLVTGLILPILIQLITSRISGKWSPRYLLPSFGLCFVLAVGEAWGHLSKKDWGCLIVMTLTILWIGMTLPAINIQARGQEVLLMADQTRPRPNFRSVAQYITENDEIGDVVLCVAGAGASTLDYYYDGNAKIIGLPDNVSFNLNEPIDLRTLENLPSSVNEANRVWLVLWQQHLVDPSSLVEQSLLDQCKRQSVRQRFLNIGLLLFETQRCQPISEIATPSIQIEETFDGIKLRGYSIQRREETIILDLWWESVARVESNYTTFVHLFRPGEASIKNLIAQDDKPPGTALNPTSAWEVGTYTRMQHILQVSDSCKGCYFRVGLYNQDHRLLLPSGEDAVVIPVN